MDQDVPSVEALLRAAAGHAVAFRTATPSLHRPEVTYADAVAAFGIDMGEDGRAADAVLQDLVRKAAPGLHATTRPRFFGWVIGGSHPLGVAADWLTSAWGQNAGNHVAAPAAAAAEQVAARWLLDLLDLPRQSSVGFVTGATMANFVCLATARAEVLRRVGYEIEAHGVFGAPSIRVLIGEDAHTTVFSALQYLGFGHANLVRVPTDAFGAMRIDALAARIGSDLPTIVVTQAGQINTGAFDPHEEIVRLARAAGAWVHVDGAFGLWARVSSKKRHLTQGVETADSWATDGHKWLQVPYDCGYAIVSDAEAHRRAMTSAASYLPPVNGSERDPSHYVPELSRRARGFATWAMLNHWGRLGATSVVERHCRQAVLLASLLDAEQRITVLNRPVILNQVLVRFDGDNPEHGDDLTRKTIAAVQMDGTCFVGGAQWHGRWVMRVSIINAATTDDDVRLSAAAIIRCWQALRPSDSEPI